VAQFSSEQFEALWESAKNKPVSRQVEATPYKADLSLTGVLNQYMKMAASYREKGKINMLDYNELVLAVNALKGILAKINDTELVVEAMSQAIRKV
jgi:diketogulonate reductase-like aldo/keto reductase